MGQLFTDADRAELLSAADFGTVALVADNPVTGVFQNGYAEALGMTGTWPQFLCASASVTAVSNGATVVIGTDNFSVVRIERDGQGMAVLVLQAEAGPS